MATKTKSKKSAKPTHVTGAGTQKYQANGPTSWEPFFRALAAKIGGKGTPTGIGIRAALAYAWEHEKELLRGAAHTEHLRAVDLVSGPRNLAPKKLTTEAKVEAQRKAAKKEVA